MLTVDFEECGEFGSERDKKRKRETVCAKGVIYKNSLTDGLEYVLQSDEDEIRFTPFSQVM